MSFVDDIVALVAASTDPLVNSPSDWVRRPLGTIAKIVNGYPFASGRFNRSKGHPVARIRDVVRGRSETFYDGPEEPDAIINDGDLLVGMDGDFNSSLWRGGRALLNQRVCKIVPDAAQVDHDFVRYILPGYLRLINQNTPSTTVKHLSSRTLAAVPIPLPRLETQRRLVARIDELFAELDDGELALARARSELETYRKALLKAAVTGELTADWRAANPQKETGADLIQRILAERRKGWESEPRNKGKRFKEPVGPTVSALAAIRPDWTWATLSQLGDFGRGKSKHRPRNDARLYGGPHPFVQTGVVTASRGRITGFDQTYSDFGLAQSKLWPAGTLCITIAANIAKTGVLQFDACFPDSIVGLTAAEGVNPEYVELVIRTLQAGLEEGAPATAQKNINLETFTGLAVPVPPSSEQFAIVETFKEAEAAGDLILRSDLDADAATLRQVILAAAFRGDLVQ